MRRNNIQQYRIKRILNLQIYIYSDGGSYDQEGNQKKIGKWVELDEYNKQVTYNCEYNMNNMKVGRWEIMYDRNGDGEYKQINNEFYNYINLVVVDHMIRKEIRKRLESGQNWIKIFIIKNQSYNGEYNMNNMKVGRWDIMCCNNRYGIYKQIIFIPQLSIYHLIKKEIRKRFESGQNCLKGFISMLKSLIMGNII